MPSTSYPLEFWTFFKNAAIKRVDIPCDTGNAAMRLRFRLNTFRKELRREEHSFANIADSVEILIRPTDFMPSLPCTLIGRPIDEDGASLLRAAGLSAEDAPDLEEITTVTVKELLP